MKSTSGWNWDADYADKDPVDYKPILNRRINGGVASPSPGLSSSGQSSPVDPNFVRRGTYWRSVKPGVAASHLSLSLSPERSAIEKWMKENRNRGVQIFDINTGARYVENIASLRESEVEYHLKLRLVSGTNLMIADDTGFSDPYVDLFVWHPKKTACKHMWRSQTKMQTLNPTWDESRRVALLGKECVMHLVCFDWDRVGNDDFLGECLIDLSKYADGANHTLKLELDQYDSTSTQDEVKGYITVEIEVKSALRGGVASHRARGSVL